MKSLLIFLIGGLLGYGASVNLSEETNEVRIKRQATEFCCHHKGVKHFVYLEDNFLGYLELECEDGSQVIVRNGTIENIQLGGEICEE